MKAWLKGGLIGLIIGIILSFLTLISPFVGAMIPPFSYLYYFFGAQCVFLTNCSGEFGCMICLLIIPVIVIVESFVIGVLIGWMNGRVKRI